MILINNMFVNGYVIWLHITRIIVFPILLFANLLMCLELSAKDITYVPFSKPNFVLIWVLFQIVSQKMIGIATFPIAGIMYYILSLFILFNISCIVLTGFHIISSQSSFGTFP